MKTMRAVLSVLALATACAPMGLHSIPLSELRGALQARPETVFVRLTDGTRYALDQPHLVNGDLAGQMHDCEGPACELVRRNGCVGPGAVRALAVWGPLQEPPRAPSPAPEPTPAGFWPRVGGGVGMTLMIVGAPSITGGGLGVYVRVAERFRRTLAAELEVAAATALLSWALRGALTVVVTPASWISLVTGLSVQGVATARLNLFSGSGHTDRGVVFAVPLELRMHWLGARSNGSGHGVEFTIGADLGVAMQGSDAPALAIGGRVGLGYGWR